MTPTNPANPEENRAQLPHGPDLTFKAPENFIVFKCDVHPWMFAFVSLFDHPFFAASDTEGSYMCAHNVSSNELHQAKVLLLREIPLSESSVERVASGWLSRSVLDLPLDEPILAAHRYVKLDAADVRAAFAKYLRPDDLAQVTQGPAPK